MTSEPRERRDALPRHRLVKLSPTVATSPSLGSTLGDEATKSTLNTGNAGTSGRPEAQAPLRWRRACARRHRTLSRPARVRPILAAERSLASGDPIPLDQDALVGDAPAGRRPGLGRGRDADAPRAAEHLRARPADGPLLPGRHDLPPARVAGSVDVAVRSVAMYWRLSDRCAVLSTAWCRTSTRPARRRRSTS